MIQRRTVLGLLTAIPAIGLGSPSMAAAPEVYSVGGLAIGGTDTVAYFRQSAAVPGRAEFALMWHGAIWSFASAENMERFEMNPDAYAPQFGGYCAYALSQGALASTIPEAWTIYQQRLYLTNSLSARTQWTTDIPGFLSRAAEHWPTVLQG